MRVSEQQKQETRARILQAACDVICEKGFKAASMREIARRAEVGDATIYNYFPNKERLLYSYCEDKQKEVAQSLLSISNFHEYTLGEQLQQLVETELDVWLADREFLQQAFHLVIYSPTASLSQLKETRRLFTVMVQDLLEAAMEAGEIPEQPYLELLPTLFWDYMNSVLAYWLKDESENFANTTRMVDGSMEILSLILETGLVGKGLDLLSFLFRTHIGSHLENLHEMAGPLKRAKRHFLEGLDEELT